MMPRSARSPGRNSFRPVLDDEALRGGLAHLDLDLLVRVGRRRVRDAVVVVRGRLGETMVARDRRRLVVQATNSPVTWQARMRSSIITGVLDRLGQLEGLLRRMRTMVGRSRPRVEQPHRGFQRIGVGALLDHRGALAVVLADHDQRAADHAGRGEVAERIGRHVGADDRLPGDAAADRIVDRGAQHARRPRPRWCRSRDGRRARPAGPRRFDQHVDQMRDRRALVAADIGHARLQDAPW